MIIKKEKGEKFIVLASGNEMTASYVCRRKRESYERQQREQVRGTPYD